MKISPLLLDKFSLKDMEELRKKYKAGIIQEVEIDLAILKIKTENKKTYSSAVSGSEIAIKIFNKNLRLIKSLEGFF